MVRIFSDTSSMMDYSEASKLNVTVFPLRISIKGNSYRDYEDIDSSTLIKWIREEYVPTSSQPPIGEVVQAFDAVAQEEILQITIADGLSGTYQSAMSAKEMSINKDRITVFNSRTLCGPQKYLVELASKLAEENKTVKEILARMEECLSECQSYLMPSDFAFLKRGGRMTALAATMGGFLKIHPIVMQTKDGKRLDKFHISRTFSAAVDQIVQEFHKAQLDIQHKIYVSHADAKEKCELAINKLTKAFPHVEIETIALSPAMITQGGPGCVAIQFIKK